MGLGVIIGIFQALLNISGPSVIAGVVTALSSVISFGAVLLIGFKKTKRRFNEVFKFNSVSPFLWVAVVVFMIGFVIVSSELDNILNYVLPMPDMFRDLFTTLMAEQAIVLAIIVMGVIPALTEELFFRGLVLDGLIKNHSNRRAIIISALLFGLVHLNPWQFLGGFVIGLFSAWICIKTNSIWLSIYIHFFNNVLYTLSVRFKNFIPLRGFNSNYAIPVEFQPLWFDITGLIIFALGILLLKKGFRKVKNGA
jgi:membrane protease YdiL (CAAX protease family)